MSGKASGSHQGQGAHWYWFDLVGLKPRCLGMVGVNGPNDDGFGAAAATGLFPRLITAPALLFSIVCFRAYLTVYVHDQTPTQCSWGPLSFWRT